MILGDVGANYGKDERDAELKKALNKLKPTILCIHGNHEIRPWNIPTYKSKEWNGGTVWYEEAYTSLLFAKDGEIYDIEGLRHIVIGGAYSVDKFYRLSRGYGWWADEQPSEEIKRYVEQQLKDNSIDVAEALKHSISLNTARSVSMLRRQPGRCKARKTSLCSSAGRLCIISGQSVNGKSLFLPGSEEMMMRK